MSAAPLHARFGHFAINAATGELRARGDVVKLSPQPFKVLELLVRRNGDVVTRNEIRDHVWCGDTFVDFEQGLNFCIRQIREALGDTADAPRFIETLPRRGYRFLMPVESAEERPRRTITRLIVLPFRMLRPDPDIEFLAFSLPDALTASLGGLRSLVVRSSAAAARFGGGTPDPKTISVEADVDMIVTGTLLRSDNEIRVTTQLTEASTGTLLWSDSTQAPVGDVFQVQDDFTRRIISSLSIPLTAHEQHMLHRDVPATAKAYEYFLRGNQLSYDAKQWSVARDLYIRCLEEDPRDAPAWARLGRIHHVMGKYLPTGTREGADKAEEAFRRALELNPDLPLAHKLYAQLDVDLGRARDAMSRLLPRAQSADSELLAGLVTTCRYCGLLDASTAAHARALQLDARIRTSVPHTWFMQADHARVATIKISDFPYIVPLSLAALGRGDEALPVLRELEKTTQTRIRDFIMAARACIEGDAADSLAAVRRIAASDFRDPEGLFYLARHTAHLGEPDEALALFERVVRGGFWCYPIMASDPWLSSLRKKAAFAKLLHEAERQHRDALDAFAALGGSATLG
jgi:DNA-binding winged helix-turn-helix (wHTH) protein/tetratricopeptide (TPR) repeat protein